MAFASEELARYGAPRRSALSGDDEYLRQLNRITDQSIGSIERAGDAVARSEENRWRGINEGINNAFDTYRDVSRQKRQEGREDKADKLASEEREYQRTRNATADEREGQKLAADLSNMEIQKRVAEGNLADSEEARAYQHRQAVDAHGKPMVGPDGNPITNADQARIMAQRAQQNQIDQGNAAIASSQATTAAQKYALTHQQTVDRIDSATSPLKNAILSGDPTAINKAKMELASNGLSQNEILRAQDLAQGQIRDSQTKARAELWLDNGYKESANEVSKVKQASVGVKTLQDLKSQYESNLKWGGIKEDEQGSDALNQFADVLENYFNDKQSADMLRNNRTTRFTIADMDKIIASKTRQINNMSATILPTAQQYKNDRYINDSLQTIKANMDYVPQGSAQQVQPIFSVTPVATQAQSNQAMVQNAGMQQPQAPAPQSQQQPMGGPPPQVAPAPMPQPPHPLFNLRVKNGR